MNRSDDCCALCVYCKDHEETLSDSRGICKIFPPTSSYDQVLEEVITLPQPAVELSGWCGCFKRLQES